MAKYVLSVDQSTQGTKALIFDEAGKMLARADLPHRQIVNDAGWVSHDPEEIFRNTLAVCRLAAEALFPGRPERLTRMCMLFYLLHQGKELYYCILS